MAVAGKAKDHAGVFKRGAKPAVQAAARALLGGQFVVLHDGVGRENEADLLLIAKHATPWKIRTMRKDAGGLICVSTDAAAAKRLRLPFATDLLIASKHPLLSGMCRARMAYGDMPAFSVSINHRSTFTGITDNDRARTIREFGRLVECKGTARDFQGGFRAIGHVFILVGRGLAKRHGHTELSLCLAEMAGAPPAVVLCEMLSDNGRAASKSEAKAYAKLHKIPFIEGKDLLNRHGENRKRGKK